MAIGIDTHVRECEPCTRNAGQGRKAPMKAVADACQVAWHTIAIDFTGNSQRMGSKIFQKGAGGSPHASVSKTKGVETHEVSRLRPASKVDPALLLGYLSA